jgi:hypothetical protein
MECPNETSAIVSHPRAPGAVTERIYYSTAPHTAPISMTLYDNGMAHWSSLGRDMSCLRVRVSVEVSIGETMYA